MNSINNNLKTITMPKQQLKTEAELNHENTVLSLSIELHLEIEKLFKLYSFRIIDADQYKSFIEQTITDHLNRLDASQKTLLEIQKTPKLEKV